MRKLVSLLLLGLVVPMICFAQGGPSPLQMVFVLKKVFPEVKDVYVFLDKNKVESVKSKFNQAGIANSVKIKLHPIDSAADIGKNIKLVPDNGTLIISDDEVLTNSKSKLYILSRCKEKNIKLITSSQDYVDSGALLGIMMDANKGIQTVVNLKHSPQLKTKFTSSFIEQAGIAAVIE